MCKIFEFFFWKNKDLKHSFLYQALKRLLIISISLLAFSFVFLSRSYKMHIVRDTRTSSRRRLNSDRARINGRRARAQRAVFAIRNIVCTRRDAYALRCLRVRVATSFPSLSRVAFLFCARYFASRSRFLLVEIFGKYTIISIV